MARNQSNLLSALERVYGQALLAAAEKAHALDSVAQEVRDLMGLIEAKPQLLGLIESRSLRLAERQAILERVFKGRVSELMYRFLQVLAQRQRFGEFPNIARAFLVLLDEKHGVVKADAWVAAALDEATLQRIAAELGRKLQRTVTLEQHVDQAMIGGMKLRIGDEIIDGSVATHLRRLEEHLVQNARQRARESFTQLAQA